MRQVWEKEKMEVAIPGMNHPLLSVLTIYSFIFCISLPYTDKQIVKLFP